MLVFIIVNTTLLMINSMLLGFSGGSNVLSALGVAVTYITLIVGTIVHLRK